MHSSKHNLAKLSLPCRWLGFVVWLAQFMVAYASCVYAGRSLWPRKYCFAWA